MKLLLDLPDELYKELAELAAVHTRGNVPDMAEDVLLRALKEPEWHLKHAALSPPQG